MIKLSEKAAKRWNLLVVIYAIAAVIYQVLYLIAPVKMFLNLYGFRALSSGLAAIGAAVLLVDLLTQRVFLKSRYGVVLVATLVALGISSLLQLPMGIANNVKVLIWQAVQMLVLYSLYLRLSASQAKRLLCGLHTVFSAAFVPAVLISLYQFLYQKGYFLVVDHTGGINRQGFLEGRLFGLFTSVHFAGVFLGLMIVGALYFACKTRRVWLRVLYVLEALLFFLYIVLSGTRSAFIAIALAAFAGFFLLAKDRLHRINKVWLRYTAVVAVSAIVAVSVLASVGVVDKGLKQIPPYLAGEKVEQTDPEATPPEGMDREDVDADVSNNRFKIWNDYLSITAGSVKSLLFGNSPGEYMNVIRTEFPDAYIVTYIQEQYPNMFRQNLIYDTHNGYISIFVSGGLLCVLVFGAFLVLAGARVVRRVFAKRRASAEFVAFSMMMVIILIATFFDSDLFFKCNSTSMLFWLLLGFTMKTMDEEQLPE